MLCKFPVIGASVGGPAICPWCDCGQERPELLAHSGLPAVIPATRSEDDVQ
jgi:hypothetical protein